ncbi:MAG: lipase family protein [Colwellia sp.]|uniref:lipase family protein n=1 Tax=Colwellia sp. TaxID=56799 RepID=UPI0025C47661|nr:lipase family protein [Colwellia sp.]NQZ25297.1 lipase family protein [Colwellia sp.]
MARISATLSSELARDVYPIARSGSKKRAVNLLKDNYGNAIVLLESSLFKGKTGGPAGIKISTGFGCVVLGNNKQHKGRAFIVFRGTKLLADWLSNFNIAPARSESGYSVHDGFNAAFHSMKPQLMELVNLAKKQGATSFHCIGHSLGGALATLCANWLQNRGESTYLYTYGSPRVGLNDFSTYLTTQMTTKRIYRVFHKTDVVPMIPTWPYVHIPDSGTDYWLHSPGIVPGAKYHDMDEYCLSADGKAWNTLAGNRQAHKSDLSIQQWLMQKTRATFSMETLQWLQSAIVFVVKKISSVAGSYDKFTVLDHLAYVLAKGINLAEKLSRWVKYFIHKVMEVLGLKPSPHETIFSKSFIRDLLGRLERKVYQSVDSALRYEM